MYDYLIIGHGLAGAILSQRLLGRGQTVRVLDHAKGNHASRVALGLFNPITGRGMIKTWKADALFATLQADYTWLEHRLGARFLHALPIYRPYASLEQQNDWEAKKHDPRFMPYLYRLTTSPLSAHALNDPVGGLWIQNAGFVAIRRLLDANEKYLAHRGAYLEGVFDEEALRQVEGGFSLQGMRFKRIIFCNGVEALKTRLFGWLPFQPVKGETMTIALQKAPAMIYNRGVAVLPLEDKAVRVGATYQRGDTGLEVTQAGQTALEERLQSLLHEPYHVGTRTAGIRPATKDRRPILGEHPAYQGIYIFNGFGSKGVSFIPYFSRMMVSFLLDCQLIDEEVNIHRFRHSYTHSSFTHSLACN